MYEALHAALHNLQATGPSGFEGFITDLISSLTGRVFFFARSGTQGGRDASTAGYGATYIDIECKRYRLDASPTTRDLLGGLQEAIDASLGRLDIWLVVSTGAIGAEQAATLRRVADDRAVAVEILDWQRAPIPQLAVLCAALPEQTLTGLSTRGVVRTDSEKVKGDLQAVHEHPSFRSLLTGLRSRLGAADVGLDHARAAANSSLERSLATHAAAIAAFNQVLCPTDPDFHRYVDRPTVYASLDAWYRVWATERPLAVVLGPEGNGKSWATMGWWAKLSFKPLTLLVTSNRLTQDNALSLLAASLAFQTELRDMTFWQRRLRQWLTRSSSAETPLLLVILDGLDERQGAAWDQIFASLAAPEWAGRLAIIATCRPHFWADGVAPFLPRQLRPAPIEVPQFDDAELAAAWGNRYPRLVDMPQAVRTFIRTPRILRLARDHVARLMESGDLTVERLLIEDWCDRRRLKPGFAHTEGDFRGLVIALARDLREGVSEFSRAHLRRYSALAQRSPNRDLDKDLAEIIEGKLFTPIDASLDRYRVRPEYVGLALGLLLAREVRDAYKHEGAAGVDSELARTLDPIGDFDQAGDTLRGACAAASAEPDYPVEARVMLFRAWLDRRSMDETQWYDFAAYLPANPLVFFDLAEGLWCGTDVNPTGRQWVADAILRWRHLSAVRDLIEARCRKWLGSWHRDWQGGLRSHDADQLERHRQQVDGSRSGLTASESRLSSQLLVEAATLSAPSMARLAILLVSHGPRVPHVPGFVAWALSRAIMHAAWEIDEVAWCLRLNEHDPAETEAALLRQIDVLLADASAVGVRAARNLLYAMGTPRAAVRLATLPEPTRFEPPSAPRLLDVDPLDPFAVSPVGLAPVLDRLARVPLHAIRSALGRTAEDYELALLEPFLARFASDVLSAFYRRLLRTASQREAVSLRQLGWLVPNLLMVIGPDEAAALDAARRSLLPRLGPGRDPHDARITEAYILAGVLGQQLPERQLSLLTERPEAALDLLLLEDLFASIPDDSANERLVETIGGGQPQDIRRVLWFLSRSRFGLSELGHQALVSAFAHLDPSVRASAFRLADNLQDRVALRCHLESGWLAPTTQIWESFFGSRALITAASRADYLALRSRISPDLLGYLALRDGTEHAIQAFAEDLDAVWETMRRVPASMPDVAAQSVVETSSTASRMPEFRLPDIRAISESARRTVRVFGRGPTARDLESFFAQLSSTEPSTEDREIERRVKALIEEAQRAGRVFFGREIRGHALAEVLACRSDLADKWITALMQSGAASWDTLEFYCALCSALGATDADRAADILDILRRAPTSLRVIYSPLKVDRLTWLAFSLPASERVHRVREAFLSDAHTDELLFQIALAAQGGGAGEWLCRSIRRDLDALGVSGVARALTLIGFLDEGEVLDATRPQLEGRFGFLADVAGRAGLRIQRNQRARHWFRQFLECRDPVEAWAAFGLFLRCVDRRFYLWGEAMKTSIPDLPRLWHQQLALNGQDIRHAVEKNEERLAETLFGLRISPDEIAPWYRTPPTVDVE